MSSYGDVDIFIYCHYKLWQVTTQHSLQLRSLWLPTAVCCPVAAQAYLVTRLSSTIIYLERERERERTSPLWQGSTCGLHWQFEIHPPWQQHSALGASLDNMNKDKLPEPMHECINPPGIDWSVNKNSVSSAALPAWWARMRETSSAYSDTSL